MSLQSKKNCKKFNKNLGYEKKFFVYIYSNFDFRREENNLYSASDLKPYLDASLFQYNLQKNSFSAFKDMHKARKQCDQTAEYDFLHLNQL